ncbi:xaa-Pro aminopeptidase 1-like [Mya arenaria]|uniref:xaa-Pro aminopeptidase 1-like n=1 Tax=Mya arenaria TaxID=6604 RepID=UPI0022E3D7B8|nr:xaa-Pro aminopeptidase 1-like [Mya arenaria]XP_052772141.1 xaa-Pro aminopeptidase 1-like [Mya arenaria]XP_052772142.1 xaa-Pro aminopeptidase 1-like [Mya arenaria]
MKVAMAAKNTSTILTKVRSLMKNKAHVSEPLNAYIVPSGDAHMSEYIAPCDCRRPFVSGFDGSAGTAVITEHEAKMWTDGRYFLQAEKQMDGNWALMKDGLPSTPTQGEWLSKVLPVGGKVGVDPFLMSAEVWTPLARTLKSNGHSLVPVAENLIDLVWSDQPDPPSNSLMVLENYYTGCSWQDKVVDVREKMKEKNAGALVISALDEIAYLFNMRGSDIEYNPVFFAYAVVTMDSVHLFTNPERIDKKVRSHLHLDMPPENEGVKVTIAPYNNVKNFVADLVDNVSGKIWISDKSSYGLVSSIPKLRRLIAASPLALMKAVKNAQEIEGMRRAHVKDAVTLCEYFSWLERNVPLGTVTEVSAASQLENIKHGQEDYVSLSFATISSTGSNGAVIHYHPSPETDKTLSTEEIYLCDSGAQYRDGTTDVTRTMHFGTPSDYEKECFTRVLKGHINLCRSVFPNGLKGTLLDSFARAALWEAGLDYLHGTGHGVGSFLNVHEGPCGIHQRINPHEVPLQEGMILSDEPGYYEDGKFGCRIENLVLVVKKETKYNFREKGFLTFEPITLVPIQQKMIEASLLTQEEIDWLNEYHTRCREVVGAELQRQRKKDAYNYLVRESQLIG